MSSFNLKSELKDSWKFNRTAWWIIIATGLILLIFTFSRTRLTTNPLSRIITVERIVDAGTMAHLTPTDTSRFKLSVDAVKIGDNIYSSKPPTYPFIMAGQAWLLKKVTGKSFYDGRKTAVRMLTLLNQIFPYLLILILALIMCRQFYDDAWTINFLLLSLTIGSLPYGYAATINNHTFAAILIFIAFFCTWAIWFKEQTSIWWFIVLGFCGGLGASNDLPSLSFLGLFLLVAVFKNPAKGIVAGFFAALPIAVTLLTYYQLTGSPIPVYLRGDLYQFEGSYWQNPEANDTFDESKWTYLFNITFGHHGLFSATPVLILGAIGMFQTLKTRLQDYWKLMALSLVGMIAVFLFVLFRTTNYGGYAIGMRWFILFMPILMFAGLPTINELGKTTTGKIVAILLLLFSVPLVLQALIWEGFIQSILETRIFN